MRQNKNVYAIGIQRVNLFTSLYSNFAIVLSIPVKINLANFNRSFFTVFGLSLSRRSEIFSWNFSGLHCCLVFKVLMVLKITNGEGGI